MDELSRDLRYALRQLARRPGFTAVLVLTLALGIGANTAVFSVVQGVLLRPLPYPEPERLAVVWSQFPTMDLEEFPASWPEYVAFDEQNRSFAALGAWIGGERALTGGDQPERIRLTAFTWTMWDVLGVDAMIGRTFDAEEDSPGRSDVVVLSHGLWERRYGGDPGIVGQSIQMNGLPTVVVGVMPPDFEFRMNAEGEAWVPMGVDPATRGPGNHFVALAGRLRPDVTLAEAQEDLGGLLARWQADGSLGHTWNTEGHPAFMRSMHEQVVGDVRTSLLVLLGAVGFVLLIACANVANLLLVRGEARQREISIRASMGAGRGRIVRQLATESLVMAVLGGVLGVALAVGGLRVLLTAAPATLPRLDEVGLDGTVLAFSAVVTLLAGLLFGLAPALQAARLDIQSSLREEGRGGTAGRGRLRFRQLLAVAETSLAVVLLVAAGLLMKSFWRLQSVDPGFNSESVLALSVNPPPASYPEDTDVVGFFQELLPRLAAVPGVTSAGGVRTPPLVGSLPPNDIEIESFEPPTDAPILNADVQVVTPGYFETLGITLRQGRAFDDRDVLGTEIMAVVDEVLAERFFPGESPVGRRVRQTGAEWSTIVGVVGAVHQEGLDVEPRAHLYLAHAQSPATWFPVRGMTLLVRTSADPLGLVAAGREVIREIDPNLPVFDVTTMESTVARSTATERFSMFLQIVFASVALALAVVGIYGVLSYSVAQRTQEIGIRMALGAERGQILRLVVRQGLVLVVLALGVGVVGALALGRVLAGLLYGVSPNDPWTYVAVVALLGSVGALASYLPARRAGMLSPQSALRYD